MAPLLLVFLAVADADREPARVMLETVAQAFGGELKLVVERFEGSPPTTAALASAARTRGATATARVLWREAGGAQVSLDVYLARSDQSIYRVLNFGAQDLPAERGRAVGLVLAALALEPAESRPRRTDASSSGPGQEKAARPEVPAAPPALGSPDKTVMSAPVGESPEPGTVSAQGESASAPAGPWALEAVMAAAAGLGGSGGGLGGGLAVRRRLGERWGARLGLQARTASLPAAQASTLAAGLTGGLFATLRPAGAVLPTWNLGARLDAILGYEMLTHFSDDNPEPVRRGRLVPVAAAWVEADWRIAPAAMLHAGVGMEVAAGTTYVVVRGVDVARLSPFRGLTELGFRLRF